MHIKFCTNIFIFGEISSIRSRRTNCTPLVFIPLPMLVNRLKIFAAGSSKRLESSRGDRLFAMPTKKVAL